MNKDEKETVKKTNEECQLSMDFSCNSNLSTQENHLIVNSNFSDPKIISLSDHNSKDKNNIDYSSLVLKHTKSF